MKFLPTALAFTFLLQCIYAQCKGSESVTISQSNYLRVGFNLEKYCSVIFKSLNFPANQNFSYYFAQGANVQFTGIIVFPFSTKLDGNQPKPGVLGTYLLAMYGSDLTISGGIFNGTGGSYWDGKGGSGGKKKPKFMLVKTNRSKYSNMKFYDSPMHCIGVHGHGNTFSNILINSKRGDALAKNTDGFDVSGNNTIITNSVIYNQDDCLAVNLGSNITFSNNFCSGGHGISIGSIKPLFNVKNIRILNNIVTDSDNGLRIKLNYFITQKTYVEDILFQNNYLQRIVKYGIVLQQNYNGKKKFKKAVCTGYAGYINRVVFKNITGDLGGKKVQKAQISLVSKTYTGLDLSGVKPVSFVNVSLSQLKC